MDPITASIIVGCGAIKLGACLAQAFEDRARRKKHFVTLQAMEPTNTAEADEARQRRDTFLFENATDEVLYVLAVLGQRILLLGVVELKYIPDLLAMVNGLWPDQTWKKRFARFEYPLQYATVVGMVFCAECWPMHIYRGFGAPVMNDYSWATPCTGYVTEQGSAASWLQTIAKEMDKIIASLKSFPRQPLLTKVPHGISKTQPDFRNIDLSQIKALGLKRSDRKELAELRENYKEYLNAVSRSVPQPKNGAFVVRDSKVLWAGWESDFCCQSIPDVRFDEILYRQSDPGRLLYAFTIGDHLQLHPGDLASVHGEHIEALLRFLHGLPGTSFDLVTNAELDFNEARKKVKKSTVKYLKKKGIDVDFMLSDPNVYRAYGTGKRVAEANTVAAAAPPPTPASPGLSDRPPSYDDTSKPSSPIAELEKTMSATTIDSTNSSGSLVLSQRSSVTRRRPVPRPRDVVLRRVKIVHETDPQDSDELHVRPGMFIDILEDHGDGWLKARLPDGTKGIVPAEFTTPV